MAAAQHVGAGAPGPVTPTSDNAPGQGRVEEGKGSGGSGDCAAKLIADATARAAMLGIEVHELAVGAWLLLNARGSSIEGAQRDMRDLVQRMRGAA